MGQGAVGRLMADERGTIEKASEAWVEDGIITEEQRAAILERYPQGDRRKRQAAIISVLGAILVGVGAILFVATNWEVIPRVVRIGLLLGSMLAAHAGGWYLREATSKSPRVGHALYLLGSLLFGATLFLGAQLYNVNAHAPGLLLLWALGVLPMAWGMRSRPILILSVGITGLWLGFQTVDWMGIARDIYGPAAVMVPFFAFGLLLWGLGRLHGAWDRLAPVARFEPLLRGFGALGVFAGLYVFTFDLPEPTAGEPGFILPLLALTTVFLIAGLAGLAYWATRASAHRRLGWAETGALGGLALLMLATALRPDLLVSAVLFNLALAAGIIALVMLGVQRGDEMFINLGLAFFVIDLVTRYFDFFFDLLDRSIFFIVGGLILLGGGWWLERQRQDLVERARGGDA